MFVDKHKYFHFQGESILVYFVFLVRHKKSVKWKLHLKKVANFYLLFITFLMEVMMRLLR